MLNNHLFDTGYDKISKEIDNSFHRDVYAAIFSEDGDWKFYDYRRIAEEWMLENKKTVSGNILDRSAWVD